MARYTISSSFLGVVLSVRLAFSKRSWPYLAAAAVPWLLCAGQRCVTRLAALARHRRSLSGYYRFLSDGKWRLEVFFRCLFDLIVRTFRIADLTLVLDDTLSPKWGRGIFGAGLHFDHAARPRAGYIWGHNWVVLAAVVEVGTLMWVALPFWVALYRSEKTCPRPRREAGPPGEFRTRHELAVEALRAVRGWFSGLIRLLADGAYFNRSLVGPARALAMGVVSRLRSDARLREAKPRKRPKGKRGRKPKRGPWLPRLSTLARQARAFETVSVRIYRKTVTLRLREVVAWWPPLGCEVKVVITRDPKRPKRVAYLVTTDLGLTAVEVVEAFARRWTIEQMFSVAKHQLGFDSAEVRKERSVRRHAALCLALVTFVEVWAYQVGRRLRARSFSAKLAAVREETIRQTLFACAPRRRGLREMAGTLAQLFSTATRAA
jgi:hypothetical protein